MMEEKITHLEEIVAHQDQQIQDLSQAVAQQWETIDVLKKHVLKINDEIERLENANSVNTNAPMSVTQEAKLNKPPHH